mgnify:CR=1 FL=1
MSIHSTSYDWWFLTAAKTKMDKTTARMAMPSEIISRMRGKEVSVTLKDGNEINGVLLSFDENTNVEIKMGDNTRFIQGEQIAALNFR